MNENILSIYQDTLNSITILYVYKDQISQEYDRELIDILSKYSSNFHVVNFKDAYEQIEIKDIDILITDIDLQCDECFNLFSLLRRRNPTCSIIIYSSQGDSDHLIKAIDLKVDKFFVKPTDPDLILKSIVSLGEYAFTLKSLRSDSLEDVTHLNMETFDLVSSSIDDLRLINEKIANSNRDDSLSITYSINEIVKKLKKVIKDSN